MKPILKLLAILLLALAIEPPIRMATAKSTATRSSSLEILIITSEPLLQAARELAAYKNATGLGTAVVTVQNIERTYQGRDVAEKARNCVIDFYHKFGIKWLILAGDAEVVPTRLIWNERSGGLAGRQSWIYDPNYVASDWYYSALEGDFDADGDSKFGENRTACSKGIDEADFTPEVYVGRLPAKNNGELSIIVDKIKNYRRYDLEKYDRLLFVLTYDFVPWYRSNDAYEYYEWIIENSEMPFPRILLSEGSGNLTVESIVERFNDGYGFIYTVSHGSYDNLYFDPARHGEKTPYYFNVEMAYESRNKPVYGIWLMLACEAGYFDGDEDSLAEALLKAPNGGCVAVVANSRTAKSGYTPPHLVQYSSSSFDTAPLILESIFKDKVKTLGEAVASAKQKRAMLNEDAIQLEWNRRDIFMFNLLGDPSIEALSPAPEVPEGILHPSYTTTTSYTVATAPTRSASTLIQQPQPSQFPLPLVVLIVISALLIAYPLVRRKSKLAGRVIGLGALALVISFL